MRAASGMGRRPRAAVVMLMECSHFFADLCLVVGSGISFVNGTVDKRDKAGNTSGLLD